jgi:hypothetical protein
VPERRRVGPADLLSVSTWNIGAREEALLGDDRKGGWERFYKGKPNRAP